MNRDKVSRHNLGAIVGDHILRHEHVHATIARYRPLAVIVVVIVAAHRRQHELLYNHLNNGLVDREDKLAADNRRALLEEGINRRLFEELVEVGRRGARMFHQRYIIRELDWVLIDHVAADVVTVEYAISMLAPRRALSFSLSVVDIAAKALAEAAHGAIDDATMCFARGYTQPEFACQLLLPRMRALLWWNDGGWSKRTHQPWRARG